MKLGFIGAGDVAQRDYLPEIHRLPTGVTVDTVCSRTTERARSVADTFNIPRWCTNYEEMLADVEIDAVVNLTPMQIHGEVNRAILEANKHLYSEKPFAANASEARKLQGIADESQLRVVAAPSVMLFPQVQLAGDILRSGSLGPVHSAVAQAEAGVPPWKGFMSDPAQFFQEGGGPAVDMAIYPLHALTGLLGPVSRITALSGRAQREFTVPDGPAAGSTIQIDVDDMWHMLLDFGSSVLATVTATYAVSATRRPELELHGLRRTLALELLDMAAPVLLSSNDPEGWESREVSAQRTSGPDHLLGVLELISAVQQRRPPRAGLPHAVHVLEILEGATTAAETGRTQNVPEPSHSFDSPQEQT